MRGIELPRLPRRLCTGCRGSFDILHLLPGHRRLLCAGCHRTVLERPFAARAAAAGSAGSLGHRAWVRDWSWVAAAALRTGGYLALRAWAAGDPVREAVVGGALAADLFTWALASVLEIPFRPTSVALELVAYLVALQLSGLGAEVAAGVDAGGAAFALAALATGLVKFVGWWRRFPEGLHEDESGPTLAP